MKQKSLHFYEVTPTFLDKYEVHLRNKGGTGGGIGVKMRAIRAIFNVAIKRGIIDEKLYPFKHYKISKLKGKSIKKALNIEEVHNLQNLDLSCRVCFLLKRPNLESHSFKLASNGVLKNLDLRSLVTLREIGYLPLDNFFLRSIVLIDDISGIYIKNGYNIGTTN